MCIRDRCGGSTHLSSCGDTIGQDDFSNLEFGIFTRTAKTTVYDQSIRALPRGFLAEIIEDSNGIKRNSGLSELTACCLSSPFIPPRSVDQNFSLKYRGGQH